jgi:hypothetical protein
MMIGCAHDNNNNGVTTMQKRIPIFKTIAESYGSLFDNAALFRKALILPAIIFLCIDICYIHIFNNLSLQDPLADEKLLLIGLITIPLFLFAGILTFNISSRIIIDGAIGHWWWKMAETKTLIKTLIVALLLTLAKIILSLVIMIFMFAIFLSSDATEDFMMLLRICFGILELTLSTMLTTYLMGRLIVLFPATAIGKQMKISQAWKLTKGNGWRLAMIIYIPMTFVLICTSIWILCFHKSLYLQVFILPIAIFMQIAAVVSNPIAYRKITS